MKKILVQSMALAVTFLAASSFTLPNSARIAPPQYNDGKTVVSQLPAVQNDVFQGGEELVYKI